ncbi:hypothetical protein [Mycolicibacterium hippocampi]
MRFSHYPQMGYEFDGDRRQQAGEDSRHRPGSSELTRSDTDQRQAD